MTEKEKEIFEIVLHKCDYYDEAFSLSDLNHKDLHKRLYSYLEVIVDSLGCHDYLFVLAITKLEEKHGKHTLNSLIEILDNYCNYKSFFRLDVAFAAFYNIALHYFRYYQINELYDLLSKNEYLAIFKDFYPLSYEIIGRYCNINGMYDRMFLMCHAAIKKMSQIKKEKTIAISTLSGYVQTFDNVAIKVGCVAAICSMFETAFIRGMLNNKKYKDDSNRFSIDHIENISLEKLTELIKIHDGYEMDSKMLSNETIMLGIDYINQAIEYNPLYPKYPYLLAQLYFYKAIYNHEQITFSLFANIKELLEKAKSLENKKANDYELRCSKYTLFLERVNSFIESNEDNKTVNYNYLKLKDDFIHMTECPPPQKRISPTAKVGDSYAFISYSTANFKSVYCDLLAYKNNGISFWYDAGVIPGEKWHQIVEEKIQKSECIICYLSPEYLMSGAVYKELSLFKKYDKEIIWIDLTGKKQISKILTNIIKNAKDDSLNKITSNMLNIITELIDDDIDMITRDKDPASEAHIQRVKSVILQKYSLCIQSVSSEELTIRNNKLDINGFPTIPNEDYVINDNHNGIYIVMDGISRKKDEYIKGGSIASSVSKLFSEAIHQYLEEKIVHIDNLNDAKIILKEGFIYANGLVKEMLDSRSIEWEGREKPGAVGIVAILINHTLCYGAVGDCMGILLRGKNKIIFSDKQTRPAFDIFNHEHDRELLMSDYVNIKKSHYGYGVVNGDENAISYFNISYINLDRSDKIYLVSDGISDLIQYAKAEEFINLSLEEMILKSNEQDILMNKPYYDDKTIIRILIDSKNEY